MTVSNVVIESGSAEPVDVDLTAAADPTSTPPDFQVALTTVTTPVGAWVAGSWESSWDATTRRLTARTPTIGAAGALAVVEGSRYTLWIRWGTVIKSAATIITN